MTRIVVIGTLDTKPEEFSFLRECLERSGAEVTMMDVGTTSESPGSDISPVEVAKVAGTVHADLLRAGDRASALSVMGTGAGMILAGLHTEGLVDGVIGMGGSGNTEVATAAMRKLPRGIPKLVLCTPSINLDRFIGSTDITLTHSVVDISGMNFMLRTQIEQASAAVVAMAEAPGMPDQRPRPVVATTMFGITTPGVTRAAEILRRKGYEILTFHSNGTGGRALEALAEDGSIDAVLDATPTELADELVGGHRSAGPLRLTAAGRHGIPQLISLGGLDVVNFGAHDTVPRRFQGRLLYGHASGSTLMRTTSEECAAIAGQLAAKLNTASGPVKVIAPTGGFSSLDRPGQPFYDPNADQILIAELRSSLDPRIEFIEVNGNINDPVVADLLAEHTDHLFQESYDH